MTTPAPTRLHDLLHDAVDDLSPDLEELTWTARRRGLAIRRRRQALGVVGTAAAVAAVVLVGGQLGGARDARGPVATRPVSSPTPAPTPSASPSSTAQTTGRRTVPQTGPAVAAGLRDAVEDLLDGSADHFRGQSSRGFSPADAYAELRWHPADGSGFSVVGINVQPQFDAPEVYRCTDHQFDCHLTQTDGGTLITYEERTPVADGTGLRLVADWLRPDGVRVVVAATNGLDLPSNRWQVTRPRPALTTEQLTTIARLDTWGPRVPERLATEGADLPAYVDLDADTATSAPTATSPTPTD